MRLLIIEDKNRTAHKRDQGVDLILVPDGKHDNMSVSIHDVLNETRFNEPEITGSCPVDGVGLRMIVGKLGGPRFSWRLHEPMLLGSFIPHEKREAKK